MRFYLVDAFADERFDGNPAGVCLVDEYPEARKMQQVALHYGWSEIAFVKRLASERFQIRWFSPIDEAPLCGHATLAAAHVIFSIGLVDDKNFDFQYGAGSIKIERRDDEKICMTFPLKPVWKCENYPFSVGDVVGVDRHLDVWKDDILYVIVLNDMNSVKNAVPNFEMIKMVDARAIAITAKCENDFDFCSRYFAPRVGIPEDPVCGSLHCRLAYYWKLAMGKSTFIAYQASKNGGIVYIDVLSKSQLKLSGSARTVREFDVANFFTNK
jgi:predicted PhzF superfamily epimerase YddE/YHI9